MLNACMKYVVEGASGVLGVKIALRPSAGTKRLPVTGTFEPLGKTWKVALLTVSGLMRSLNLTRMTVLVGTPVAPLIGSVSMIEGRIRSAPLPVVKLVVTAAERLLPARSLTPVTLTVKSV